MPRTVPKKYNQIDRYFLDILVAFPKNNGKDDKNKLNIIKNY